jgi:hypothetical protein
MLIINRKLLTPAILFCLCVVLAGCESAYYSAWEKVGVYKRDLLVDRVEDAQDSQEEAREEFNTVLERFNAIVDVEPGRLQSVYNNLNSSFEKAEMSAAEVSDHIDAVEDVSEDLFSEWEDEIEIISSPDLRDRSRRQLIASKERYGQLLTSMRRAEVSMEPVLTTFRDQVLFLKHNLNAQAINALQGELRSIETDVSSLIAEMESSIAESRAFIDEMQLLEI